MPSRASTDASLRAKKLQGFPRRYSKWPLVWRLPVAMAALVLAFTMLLTHLGLTALEQRQASQRVDVGAAFLDTLAGVLVPSTAAQTTAGEIQDILAAAAQFKPSLRNEAVVVCCLEDGASVISSAYSDDALERQTEIALTSLIERNAELQPNEPVVEIVSETEKLLIVRAYPVDNSPPILLASAFDLGWQRAEQNALRQRALLIDVVLSLLAGLITFVVARSSLKPVDALTQALSDPRFDADALADRSSDNTEIGRLHRALRDRADLQAKAEAVAAAEGKHAREAMLARLAAGLAHEVRNPVAGMSAAASTLRRYGDDKAVREETIDLIERGLQSIDHVAASMLSTYRPPEGNRDLLPADIEDVKTLIQPKAQVKQINLAFASKLEDPFPTSAEAVRQIALNLLLNAIDASPEGSLVGFEATPKEGHLSLQVADSGSGLPDEALHVLTDGASANTPQTRRLGLWLVHHLIDDVEGRLGISTRPGEGTTITITIPARSAETIDA